MTIQFLDFFKKLTSRLTPDTAEENHVSPCEWRKKQKKKKKRKKKKKKKKKSQRAIAKQNVLPLNAFVCAPDPFERERAHRLELGGPPNNASHKDRNRVYLPPRSLARLSLN